MLENVHPEWLDQAGKFAIALLLGFLIGVEREKEKGNLFAGMRTFSLIALLGALSALFTRYAGNWFFGVAFAVLGLFLLTSYRVSATPDRPGGTTEVAALLAFLYGALVWWDHRVPAVALTVVTVLLLASKPPLVRVSGMIARQDVMAAIQFGVISAVILPMLPNRPLDPLGALNPHRIWMMVVLLAGFNLAAYAIIKAMGPRRGIGVMSLLGGLLSSTALTVTFARRSRTQEAATADFAAGLVLAAALVFPRILAIVLALNRPLGRILALPLLAACGVGLLASAAVWLKNRLQPRTNDGAVTLDVTNPCELWPALQFGFLFGLVLLVSKLAQRGFDAYGLFASSAVAGLLNTDAITLSLADMATQGATPIGIAALGIVLAAAASMLSKIAIVAYGGSPRLRRKAIPALLIVLAAAVGGVLAA